MAERLEMRNFFTLYSLVTIVDVSFFAKYDILISSFVLIGLFIIVVKIAILHII